MPKPRPSLADASLLLPEARAHDIVLVFVPRRRRGFPRVCLSRLTSSRGRSRSQLVPRLRKFNRDLKILNTVLTDLIARAKSSEHKADLEDLQARNYDKVRRGGRVDTD